MRVKLTLLAVAALAALSTLLVAPLTAAAAPPGVLLVNASGYVSDVQAKLTATGRFGAVDLFDASSATPTLAQLQAYGSVLVFSDGGFSNRIALGDVLADYVDGGGHLAVAVFALYCSTQPQGIGGRLSSGGYLPFDTSPCTQTSGTPLTLVADQPADPLLAGVSSFDGGSSSYHNNVTLVPGATQVAHWSNNVPLVAFKQAASGADVVGLNFYPPSSSIRSDFWTASTDGAKLLANALVVADRVPPVITVPADMRVEATSPAGAPVTFVVTATDAVDGALSATCAPASGSTFALGATTVTCTAVDVAGNTASKSFKVTVVDTTAPAFGDVADIVLTAPPGATTAIATYSPAATDAVGATVTCNPPSGSEFALGDTTVTCTAADAAGNSAQRTFKVSVLATALIRNVELAQTGSPLAAESMIGVGLLAAGGVLTLVSRRSARRAPLSR